MEFSPLEITLLILAPMIIAFYVGFSRGEGVGVEKTINTFVRLNIVEEIDEEEFFDDEV